MRGIFLLVLAMAISIAYAAFPMFSARISVNQDPSDSPVTATLSEHPSQEVVGKASDTQKTTEESVINAVDIVDRSSDDLNGTESQSGRSASEESQPSDSNSKIESTAALPPEEEIGVEEPYVVWGGGKQCGYFFPFSAKMLFLHCSKPLSVVVFFRRYLLQRTRVSLSRQIAYVIKDEWSVPCYLPPCHRFNSSF